MYSLPESEFVGRLERLRGLMEKQGLDAVYMSGTTNLRYFVGFNYLATERPAAIIVPKSGEPVFFGPAIERDHLPHQTRLISKIYTYPDYPGEVHPMVYFARWLGEVGLEGKRIGVDNPAFYSSPYGYTGPLLSELVKNTVFVPVGQELYSMRLVKSRNELELVRESVRWGEVAHRILQELVAPGAYDFEIAAKASLEATLKMKRVLGPEFKGTTPSPLIAHAGMRGQVGPNSAYPHAISIERPIQKGDILGTGASADVCGYHSELERNLFVGEPDARVRRYHEVALKMQEAAFSALRPGAPCSEADRASIRVAKEYGVTEFLRHHSGHGMGLEGHEPPFLDVGDNTVLRPGMVLSCEPGIYVPGVGGFRHSDTVIITEDGAEWVNKYPRDTDELIVKC